MEAGHRHPRQAVAADQQGLGFGSAPQFFTGFERMKKVAQYIACLAQMRSLFSLLTSESENSPAHEWPTSLRARAP